MRTRNESWRLTYGVVAAFALTGLAFSDIYRPPRPASSVSPAPPRQQYVYLDREQIDPEHSLLRYITPLHSVTEQSAPLDRDTPFIATKENPFSGRTTTEDMFSWALAAPNSGAGAQRQEAIREQTRAQTETERSDSLFALTRQNMNRASAEMMFDAGEALRPFQDLPQRLRPESELLIHFDSRGQVSLGTIAEKNAEYFYRMVARISEQWNIYFPKFQHFYGLLREGHVLLTFTLDLDGKVGEIRLVHSYGQTSIDESCVQAIRAAAEFGPIPAEYREKGGMVIPFAFVYHRPERPLKLFH